MSATLKGNKKVDPVWVFVCSSVADVDHCLPIAASLVTNQSPIRPILYVNSCWIKNMVLPLHSELLNKLGIEVKSMLDFYRFGRLLKINFGLEYILGHWISRQSVQRQSFLINPLLLLVSKIRGLLYRLGGLLCNKKLFYRAHQFEDWLNTLNLKVVLMSRSLTPSLHVNCLHKAQYSVLKSAYVRGIPVVGLMNGLSCMFNPSKKKNSPSARKSFFAQELQIFSFQEELVSSSFIFEGETRLQSPSKQYWGSPRYSKGWVETLRDTSLKLNSKWYKNNGKTNILYILSGDSFPKLLQYERGHFMRLLTSLLDQHEDVNLWIKLRPRADEKDFIKIFPKRLTGRVLGFDKYIDSSFLIGKADIVMGGYNSLFAEALTHRKPYIMMAHWLNEHENKKIEFFKRPDAFFVVKSDKQFYETFEQIRLGKNKKSADVQAYLRQSVHANLEGDVAKRYCFEVNRFSL